MQTFERLGDVDSTPEKLTGRYADFWSFVLDAQRMAPFGLENQVRYHKEWLRDEYDDWYGLERRSNFEAVAGLVKEGWPAGLRKMDEALGRLEVAVPPVSIRRKRQRGEWGDELDIHRVYAGDFGKAFSSMRRPPGSKRKTFKIAVDSIAFGGRGAEEMFWQGAAAIKLGQLLSEAGYIVELVSAFRAEASGAQVYLEVVCKSSAAPLDLCSAAATMALPAFFRCIGHAWIHANLSSEHCGSGVSVERLRDDDADIIAPQSIDSSKSAARWVSEQIAKLDGGQGQSSSEEGEGGYGGEDDGEDEDEDEDEDNR